MRDQELQLLNEYITGFESAIEDFDFEENDYDLSFSCNGKEEKEDCRL